MIAYYLPYQQRTIGTDDPEVIAKLYAVYMSFLPADKDPGMYDGSSIQEKRIRVSVGFGTLPGDENGLGMNGKILDICADGTVVDARQVKVSVETGMPS